jgi:alpha-aminoadipic semialdehyde synthase
VGAKIVEELSGSTDLVIGIKEAPVQEVQKLLDKEQRKRTWMMFSHTHKGQVRILLDIN